MMNWRKTRALMLCLAMCLSVFSAGAFAQQETALPDGSGYEDADALGAEAVKDEAAVVDPGDGSAEADAGAVTGQEEQPAPGMGSDEAAAGDVKETAEDLGGTDDGMEPVEAEGVKASFALVNSAGEDEPVLRETANPCGENAFWELSSDETTLTIRGSGEMEDYTSATAIPWYAQRTTITSVVIEEGISSIGDYAFDGLSALTAVSIPGTVTSIGERAFVLCSQLTAIDIPSSVASIGAYAFTSSGLTEIVLPVGVGEIGESAFSSCYDLTRAVIPEGITSLERNVFNSCEKLTQVSFPSSLTSLGYSVFSGCKVLNNITLPANLMSIGEKAFYQCKGMLQELELPQGLTSIGKYAFGESGVRSITIPGSVSSIGDYAFYGCLDLHYITVSEGVESLSDYMFQACKNVITVSLPESLRSIGKNAFYGISERMTGITLPDGLTFLGSAAFQNCYKLESVSIPSGLTSLEASVFRGCSKITEISIPSNITSIGNCAFQETGLRSIVIPDSVTSIGASAFNGCTYLASVVLPENLTKLENNLFYKCSDLAEVNIPDSVTSIGNNAFYNCRVSEIVIPDGVTSIPLATFCGCILLSKITIPASVTEIGVSAFDTCRMLKNVWYKGTADQWSAISINYLNDALTSATKHYINEFSFPVEALATDSACSASVANISIDPVQDEYLYNTSVTVTAEEAEGYQFLGWYPVTAVSGGQVAAYDADHCLADTLSYTFSVLDKTRIAAVFQEGSAAPYPNGSSVIEGYDHSVWSIEATNITSSTARIDVGYYVDERDIDHLEFCENIPGTRPPKSAYWKVMVFVSTNPTFYEHLNSTEATDSDYVNWPGFVSEYVLDGTCSVTVRNLLPETTYYYCAHLSWAIQDDLAKEEYADNFAVKSFTTGALQTVPIQLDGEAYTLESPSELALTYTPSANGVYAVITNGSGSVQVKDAAGNLLVEDLTTEPNETINAVFLGEAGSTYYIFPSGVGTSFALKNAMDTMTVLQVGEPVVSKARRAVIFTAPEGGGTFTVTANPTAQGSMPSLQFANMQTMQWEDIPENSDTRSYEAGQQVIMRSLGPPVDAVQYSVSNAATDVLAAIRAVDPEGAPAAIRSRMQEIAQEYAAELLDRMMTNDSELISAIQTLEWSVAGGTPTDEPPTVVTRDSSTDSRILGAKILGASLNTENEAAQIVLSSPHVSRPLPVSEEYTTLRFSLTMTNAVNIRPLDFPIAVDLKISDTGLDRHNFRLYHYTTEDPDDPLPEPIIPLVYHVDNDAGGWDWYVKFVLTSLSDFDLVDLPDEALIQEDENLKFSARSLVLRDNLAINFKVLESTLEGYQDPYVVFSCLGKEYQVDSYTTEYSSSQGENQLSFQFRDIPPHHMKDTVTATLYATDGEGVLTKGQTIDYSVWKYCNNQLSRLNAKNDLSTLLVDLLNYGAQAQIYQGYKTDDLANNTLTEEQAAWGTSAEPTYSTVQNSKYTVISDPEASWVGVGLTLYETIRIRYKIAVSDLDGVTLKVVRENGGSWTIDASSFVDIGNGRYYVYFNGLTANQLRDTVFATVYRGEDPISNTLSYSVESYVYSQMNKTDESLKALLRVMMMYGDSAAAYAGS